MVDVLVTGGAGFIGSNFVRLRAGGAPDWHVTTLDKLTYAGRRENLHDVLDDPRHTFVHGDIATRSVSRRSSSRRDRRALRGRDPRGPVDPWAAGDFIRTDVEGTFVLLEAAGRAAPLRRFVQISTDEVYGSVPGAPAARPTSSEAAQSLRGQQGGADRLAYSYWATYGVPVIITRASNNYGPYQFPEKVIPLFVTNAIDDSRCRCTATAGTCATGCTWPITAARSTC
jgi:dTDP-glucose 4,6-dehydratase